MTTQDWQQKTADHLADFGEPGTEIVDSPGGLFLSVPIRYRCALELEEGDDGVVISLREWDRTNGLNIDEVICVMTYAEPRMLARVTRALIAEYETIENEAQAEIDDVFRWRHG